MDPRAGAAGLRRNRRSEQPTPDEAVSRRVAVAPPPPSPPPASSIQEDSSAETGSVTSTPWNGAALAAHATRNRATTVYLAGRVYEMLRVARAREGRSQVDIILDVVSAHFERVRRSRYLIPDTPVDPVLGIARRTRRRVDDGRVVQLRFTADEKAALSRLAKEADMTVSSMITECLLAEHG